MRLPEIIDSRHKEVVRLLALRAGPLYLSGDIPGTHFCWGLRGSAVGRGIALQVGSWRVRLPIVSLEFFIDIIFPAALWPWGDSASKRNEYH